MKEQAEGLQREYDRVCGLLKQADVSYLVFQNRYHFKTLKKKKKKTGILGSFV